MGWGAGRKLNDVLRNSANVIAVELVCAAQGCEQRVPLEPAPGTRAILDAVRSVVSPLVSDRPVGVDIEAAARSIEEGGIAAAMERWS